MLNFKTYLEEGRDAPLYHATYASSIIAILKQNTLDAKTHHMVHKIYDFHIPKDKVSSGSVKGSSLTRHKKLAQNWADGSYFEFDQRKLSQRYKIIPFNYFQQNSRQTMAEFEEFVVGPVKNIHLYIKRITLVKINVNIDALSFLTEYCKKHKIELTVKEPSIV